MECQILFSGKNKIIYKMATENLTQSAKRLNVNSFSASGDCSRLLITFANSLDSDQVRQNVGPDLDPNCLTL